MVGLTPGIEPWATRISRRDVRAGLRSCPGVQPDVFDSRARRLRPVVGRSLVSASRSVARGDGRCRSPHERSDAGAPGVVGPPALNRLELRAEPRTDGRADRVVVRSRAPKSSKHDTAGTFRTYSYPCP